MLKLDFDFTKDEYEYLKEKLMLNKEMEQIFEMKRQNCSIVEISFKTHLSVRTVNRRINKLKRKIMRVL